MKLVAPLSDDQLIALFQEGQQQAFEMLLHRHRQKLFLSIYNVVRDWHLSEDILQEVMLKICSAFQEGRYRYGGKFLPWALRIARNQCFDHLRVAKYHPVLYLDACKTDNLQEESTESLWINEHNCDRLQSLLVYLSKDQQLVIFNRYYKHMKFKEIAALTNCSVSTVLARMRYAHTKLRKLMTQDVTHYKRA